MLSVCVLRHNYVLRSENIPVLYCTVGRKRLCDGNMHTDTLMYMFLVFVCSILYDRKC